MANEVEIAVSGRDTGAKAALTGGAQAASQLGNQVERAGNVARGVLAAGFIQQIGAAAQRFLGQAASAASGLEQAVGGTKAVFGDASGAVDEFGKRSAQAVGLSEREFREATTSIGGQLKRMTGDVDLAANSSIQLVQIGADLAATYGGTTREAVDAFSAALRGEADPAERFNLNLKISQQNAKAVELGLAQTTNEVDENARAQALLALITEQSADAQGQFAREADTAAVSQQKAQAAWENAQATLGQTLLPVMATAAEVVSTLAEGFGSLPGPVQGVVGAVAALGAGLLVVLPRIAAAKVALAELGVSTRLSGTRMRGFLSIMGRAAGIIGAAVGAFQLLSSSSSDAGSDVAGLQKDIERLVDTGRQTAVLRDLFGEGAAGAEEFKDKLDVATASFFDWSDHLNRSFDDINQSKQAFKDLDQALTALVKDGADADRVFQTLVDTYQLNESQVERLRSLLPNFQNATERATEATKDQADSHGDAAEAAEDQRNALQKLHEQLRAQTDPMFALIRAQQELDDKQRAYTEAVDEFERESPQARSALVDMTEAALNMQGAAADAAEVVGGQLPAALKDTLQAAGFTKREIREVEDAFERARRDGKRFAGRYRARVDVRGARAAERSIERLNADLGRLRDRTVDVTVRTHRGPRSPVATGGLIGAQEPSQTAQAGGPRGNDVLVGEQGPEIVELPRGSRVIPAGQSQAILQEAREALAAIESGRGFFEDFSFRGGGRERFNAFFSDWFYSGGGQFNRREARRFLHELVDELERPRREPRPPAATGQQGAQTFTADGGKFVLELIIRGDGSRRSEFIVDEIRESLRVNATFRREVAEVVRR